MWSGKKLRHYPDMPLTQQNWDYPHFNPEQKLAFGKVVDSAKNNKGKIFFLHSAGDCGKTHVSNTIAAAICADGDVTLCVASSAIAALLLQAG